jgi:uncharacterized protein YjbJ (UPF0337 family)
MAEKVRGEPDMEGTEELAGVLQQRYGYGKKQAESEIHDWLHPNDKKH